MSLARCAAKCAAASSIDRRSFLAATGCLAGSALFGGCASPSPGAPIAPVRQHGPASRCRSRVHVAFVRRKEPYGMWWPGAVYDGEAARRMYDERIRETAATMNMALAIRPEPIHSPAEADEWIARATADRSDGLMVVLLDRQEHAWPTAHKAADCGIPTVVFSPVGSSFTTNTVKLAGRTGTVIYATDDFAQPAYGLKMIHARAKMRATRCVVLKGSERREAELADLGIRLRTVPAARFLELYDATPETEEIRALARDFMDRALELRGASREDVLCGARAYVVARRILEEEEGDAITMDCLGAIGGKNAHQSLPCLAWSRMNDEAIPAACEADLGAVASHVLVQYLFDRPGFQQDPVAETARKGIIGAHCSCPTRLDGFDRPSEPFVIRHHHAERDATAMPIWRKDQPVTSLDVLPGGGGEPSKMIISSGRVLENVKVPPAGGCVVSVMVKLDGVEDVLTYPGFHQVFFYGDFRDQLADFCQLHGFEAQVV